MPCYTRLSIVKPGYKDLCFIGNMRNKNCPRVKDEISHPSVKDKISHPIYCVYKNVGTSNIDYYRTENPYGKLEGNFENEFKDDPDNSEKLNPFPYLDEFINQLAIIQESKKLSKEEIFQLAQVFANAKLEEEEKELKTGQKQIEDKYSTDEEDRHKELGEQDEYYKKLEIYSCFDGGTIGNIIAILVRTFEGTNYVYQDAYYYTPQFQKLLIGEELINVKKHLRIVISGEDKLDSYPNRNSLYSIVKNGNAIVLEEDDKTLENGILFYRANLENHSLEQCVDFGRFSYVKEFIDGVISYKVEHGLLYITYGELENLMVDFIAARVEQIEENYAKLEQQQEDQMKTKLATEKENRQLQLRKILDKKQD